MALLIAVYYEAIFKYPLTIISVCDMLLQVLMLLDAMKLSVYKQAFCEETIDGEVLVECDEQILEKELGVKNKLHRMRLMKLVSGRHSSHYYFTEGLNPYGQLAAPPS